MTDSNESSTDEAPRKLSDTPLVMSHKDRADSSDNSDRSRSQNPAAQRRPRPGQKHGPKNPSLHHQVKSLERRHQALHNDLSRLEEQMQGLRDTVMNTSKATSDVVMELLVELKRLDIIDSEDEIVPTDPSLSNQLQQTLQGMDMETEDTKKTDNASPAAPEAPNKEITQEGMGPVTKAVIGGLSLTVTFLAGLAFGSRRGYNNAMEQIEGGTDQD